MPRIFTSVILTHLIYSLTHMFLMLSSFLDDGKKHLNPINSIICGHSNLYFVQNSKGAPDQVKVFNVQCW